MEESRSIIVHLDCDAFFAAVHELSDPRLVGKPVIVGGRGPRSIVTTASYSARRHGVKSAMSMETALGLCPRAIVVEPDRAAYTGVSERVWELVGARVPILERVGIDESYADVTEWESEGEPVLARLRSLVEEVSEETGISLSVGVSPNRLLSKILSDEDKPRGFVAMGREEAVERLAGRHPSILPGVGPVTAETLDGLGWSTLAVCRAQSLERLREVLGESRGRWMYDASRLIGPIALETDRPRKSVSSEHTFSEDVPADDPYTLRATVERLAEEVASAATERGSVGRNVAVKFRTADWRTYTRSVAVPSGIGGEGLVEAAVSVFDAHRPDEPVRLVGVRLGSLVLPPREGTPEQLQLDWASTSRNSCGDTAHGGESPTAGTAGESDGAVSGVEGTTGDTGSPGSRRSSGG